MSIITDIENYKSSDLSGKYTLEDLSVKLNVPSSILAEILQNNGINPTQSLVNDEYVEWYDISQFDDLTQDFINRDKGFFLRNSGRIYGYSDERWISIHDDQYGSNYFQYAENAGSGTDPIIEWEHNGIIIPKGTTLRKFMFLGRSNSTQYTDLRFCLKEVVPNPISRFATGYDNDNEVSDTTIADELFSDMIQNANGQPYSGNLSDKHLGTIDLNHKFTEDSELRLYVKPVGNLTGTRYFYSTWTFQFV